MSASKLRTPAPVCSLATVRLVSVVFSQRGTIWRTIHDSTVWQCGTNAEPIHPNVICRDSAPRRDHMDMEEERISWRGSIRLARMPKPEATAVSF
mgnify:CR=1 FL=1